jgi:hypothetical protein
MEKKAESNAKAKRYDREHEGIEIRKRRNNFVMIDIDVVNDNLLTLKAKGIFAYILAQTDDYNLDNIINDLINNSKDGKSAIYSGLDELKKYGYITKGV